MYVFCRILVLLIGTGNEKIYQTNRMNNKQKKISVDIQIMCGGDGGGKGIIYI